MRILESSTVTAVCIVLLAGCGAKRNTGNQSDTNTDVSTTCIDLDGDDYGIDCALGPDCDDADPLHGNDCPDCDENHQEGCACVDGESYSCYEGPAETLGVGPCVAGTRFCVANHLGPCAGQVTPLPGELCGDGVDNDCNGLGDEEVTSACGDCDPDCYSEGDLEPDPSDEYADGIIDNPDGPGVILGTSEIDAGYAWVANAAEGTVSKLRLSDGVEVGRFRVGLWGTSDDQPSRTAVDSLGNAYVASRAHTSATNNQPSVTKIAGDDRYCDDRNGDTILQTSTDSTPLALGEDECVIWTVPVGNPGGTARALAIDLGGGEFWDGGNPWVGLWSELRFLKLDQDDGTVLEEVPIDINPYGAAIDADGWIWVSGRNPEPGYIQRFHSVTLVVDPAIAVSAACSTGLPYGITVAPDGRVWIGSHGSYVCRYDPITGVWFDVNLGLNRSRGVAADSDGTIWASCYMDDGSINRIAHFDADGVDLGSHDISGVVPIGVGLDELGQVWTVNHSSNTATRLDKTTGVQDSTTVGTGPYTYSDFTGYQRSLMMPHGSWEHTFERCDVNDTDHWGLLYWDADTPSDSQITIYGFSADSEDVLTEVESVVLASAPPDIAPVDIAAKFAAAGVYLGVFLRVVIVMEPSTDTQSPVFRSVDVQWHCSDLV